MTSTSQKLQTRAASGSSSGPTILDLIEKQKTAIARALPKHLSADRLTRILVTEVRRNPKLAQADPTSLLGAVMQAAQLGLEPGPLGHAYLVPRYNGKTKTTDVTLQIGYRGYIDLARRSGQIVSIVAREVCEGDHFEFEYGTDERILHKPALKGRGDAYAYYGVALLSDGGRVVHVMSREDVEKFRNRSQAKDSGPWATDYDAMSKKTVIRRMVPWLPLSTELAVAVEADDHTVTLDADSIVIVGQDDAEVGDRGDDVIEAEDVEPEPEPAVEGDGK